MIATLMLAVNLLIGETPVAFGSGLPADITNFQLPPVTLAPKEISKYCIDSHGTDDFRPIVMGSIISTSRGYAVALLGLPNKPPDSVRAVLGYFVVDDGPPTYVIVHPGQVERFLIPGLSSGRHDATIGTIYFFSDGTTKWIDSLGNCFVMKSRFDL